MKSKAHLNEHLYGFPRGRSAPSYRPARRSQEMMKEVAHYSRHNGDGSHLLVKRRIAAQGSDGLETELYLHM